jgi:hypothetical protein
MVSIKCSFFKVKETQGFLLILPLKETKGFLLILPLLVKILPFKHGIKREQQFPLMKLKRQSDFICMDVFPDA